MADKMVKFVISLTAIPPGFVHVRECLQSLLVQAADVAAISLHIPQVISDLPMPNRTFLGCLRA